MKILHFLLPLVVRASRSQLCCLTRFVLRLANARTIKILDATKMQHNGKALCKKIRKHLKIFHTKILLTLFNR